VELFEEIRRGHAAGETIQGLATKHGNHRRMVGRRSARLFRLRARGRTGSRREQVRSKVRSTRYCNWIWKHHANSDTRQTALRIWTRLRAEHPEHPIGEPTVRRYVAQRKRELGLKGREVFVPQSNEQGQEAQVDWFEAEVRLDGELRTLQFFAMRSMASGDGFHRAHPFPSKPPSAPASVQVSRTSTEQM
jgi:hypothetical protein